MKTTSKTFAQCGRGLLALLIAAASALAASPAAAPAGQQPSQAIESQVNAMLAKLTLQQKIELIGGEDNMFTRAMPSIGLPRLKMSDGPVGVRVWGPSVAYAAGIGLAASWDPALARRVGVALGWDARARGVNILLGPGADMYRAPMNGRNFEYFGEDPYLASAIAVGYIEGLQSQHVVATIKHYAVNDSEYDRQNENAIVSERALREIYLPVFEAAVKQAHVGAFMDSYNVINGEHATASNFLNNQVLKKDWGFKGILMSDWGAAHDTVADANAGLDLEMPSPRYFNSQALLPAIKAGQVSEATIDDKVRRILRVAMEFGFLNHDQTDLGIPLYNPRSLSVALQSAEESMVLLKNEGHLLPLDLNRVHTIALIGPDAYPDEASAGGSGHVTVIDPVSFLGGLTHAFAPRTKVLWNQGLTNIAQLLRQRFSFGPGSSPFTIDSGGTQPGLKQEEFDSGQFTGSPDRVSTVGAVNRWGGSPFTPPSAKHTAIRWEGYYTPKAAGPTAFLAGAVGRDSYKLYVNGNLAVDAGPGTGEPREAVLHLPEGQAASIRFDYSPDGNAIRAGFTALPAADLVLPEVKKIASEADVAVISVGFDPETEGEGHDRTYRLPPGQEELIKEVAAANPRTVVLITSGGSVATADWIESVPAVVETWYTGNEGGRALARILSGEADPSGHLPMTWWRTVEDNPTYEHYYEPAGSRDVTYSEGVFVGYRAVGKISAKPLFPFGFGLSYTTFSFSHLSVTPDAASPMEPVTVSFDVRNTGTRTGADVAQVYVGDPSATAPRPQRELKAFERVELAPGATKHVTLKLDNRSFAYWDTDSHGWKVDTGKFVVYVGDSSANTPLEKAVTMR